MKGKLKRVISLTIATLVFSTFLNFQPTTSLTPFSTVEYAQAKTSKSQTVYITDTGNKYHRSNCRTLKKSKTKTSLKRAKADGYEPCKVCHPPK
jgi:nitrate/TMAO reductase-like tetraheme cytochrome c subunit